MDAIAEILSSPNARALIAGIASVTFVTMLVVFVSLKTTNEVHQKKKD